MMIILGVHVKYSKDPFRLMHFTVYRRHVVCLCTGVLGMGLILAVRRSCRSLANSDGVAGLLLQLQPVALIQQLRRRAVWLFACQV